MPDLSPLQWLLLVAAASLVGFGKTAIGGVTTIAVAVFAGVLPARESTGALLPLLLCGDVLAVGTYRRHADWSLLWRLFPWVGVGTVLGAIFLARVDDNQMRHTIGAVLLLLVGLQVFLQGRRRKALAAAAPVETAADPSAAPRSADLSRHAAAAAVGVAAGITTMVANAAGAVMTLYLLLSGLTMLQFLGTGAWFFLIVNAFKVPFSVGLGLITPGALALDLALAPAVLAGGAVGMVAVRHLRQRQFEIITLVLTAVSAAFLAF